MSAFRESYLGYQQLTEQLRAWADEYPEHLRLHSIGKTEEGRDIWLVEVGRDLDRKRPSIWVDGNMHACELAGSSVAMAIIEDVLAVHRGELVLPAPIRERVLEVPFCVVPRVSPDGAEAVLTSARYVRSVPRRRSHQDDRPHWVREDIDGDGMSLMMRIEDPAGTFVECPEHPGLMLPRRIEDPGPYYKIFPEGHVAHYDGDNLPDPMFLSDNRTDLNRNFPFSWRAEHEQIGSGDYPGSEPESRALMEAATARPELFAWINLHCFGGVFIRPLGDKPDNKMNLSDLAVFKQLAQWADELTGYPMVSGFEEFTYEPDSPIHGDLSDWAYNYRGCVAYVVELWDLFRRIGMERPKKFVDYYRNISRDDLIRLAEWDREHNHGRVFLPWRKHEHAQLGDVEIGGIDFRVGIWNPPYDELPYICRSQSAMTMRVAALAPALEIEIETTKQGDSTTIEVKVANHGYLPTHVLDSSKPLAHNQELVVVARSTDSGVSIRPEVETIGHLDGWGRGLGTGVGMPAYLPDRGSGNRQVRRLVATGSGPLTVRVGSPRTGWIEKELEL
ncbi:MAG: peptidase M14 [Deltaproteobacteria bacterium]|nr:peptidase M14 [Deltaproteobacteria bacterium]